MRSDKEEARASPCKHGLEEREDALGARRVGRHGEHDARCHRPRGELLAVAAPEEQDGVGECLHMLVVSTTTPMHAVR